MGIEAIKGAGMNFQASASAPEIKAEAAHKVEVAEAPQVSESIAKDTEHRRRRLRSRIRRIHRFCG